MPFKELKKIISEIKSHQTAIHRVDGLKKFAELLLDISNFNEFVEKLWFQLKKPQYLQTYMNYPTVPRSRIEFIKMDIDKYMFFHNVCIILTLIVLVFLYKHNHTRFAFDPRQT